MGEPTAGTVLAERYRLVAQIGGGAMGTVWRASPLDGGEDVAIKILSPELRDHAALVERFEREAAAACEVDHRAVCRIFEQHIEGEAGPFLAMELLEGVSLAERLDVLPALSAAELLEHVIEILDGLEAVHATGIVHRDLKPDNIFLTVDGAPKLIDFGVSKGRDFGASLTVTGEMLGTPIFMAPEQADSAKSVTPAADIYGVGAILYDALAGRDPFAAESLAMLLLAITFEEPAPLEEQRPGIPVALATLVHEAMAKAPTDRPATAAGFRDSLIGVLADHRYALSALQLPRQ